MPKTTKFAIENYKSIRNLELSISDRNKEKYLALLGVNETGKTSLLEAMHAVSNQSSIDYERHCHKTAAEGEDPIKISIEVRFDKSEQDNLRGVLESEQNAKVDGELRSGEESSDPTVLLKVVTKIASDELSKSEIRRLVKPDIRCSIEVLSGGTISRTLEFVNNDGETEAVPNILENEVLLMLPKVELWKGREADIISDQISLDELAEGTSTAYSNCLKIAGLSSTSIERAVGNSARQSELREKLNNSVTDYINKRWPGHDVQFEFDVQDERVACNIIDRSDPNRKRYEPSARSDGFKKMISFLLSLSVDYEKSAIKDSILLLDEPELFLHPEAQRNFRDELTAISAKNNNIVVVATHSMYMIHTDKINLCYAVTKTANSETDEFETQVESINPDQMSFARINYDVFNIPTPEYHSEIYGMLHQKHIDSQSQSANWSFVHFDENVLQKKNSHKLKTRTWKREKRDGSIEDEKVSLHTYIRHKMHHPENSAGNPKFSEDDLRDSIVRMLDFA